MLVTIAKTLILIIVLVRLFFVTYDIFYNSFVQIDTPYFVERFARQSNQQVTEEYLKHLANKEIKSRSLELVILYVVILIIGII